MSRYRDDDPPDDEPWAPTCCGDYMDWNEDGSCTCPTCGKHAEPPRDDWNPGPEPVIELPDDFFEVPPLCPHGKTWGDCDACDHLSDIAYDAAREKR